MSEIVNFVNHGAASITPAMLEKVLRQLPQWKLEFTQIYAPLFPHLVDQLEFLADAVEDTAEGAYKDLPYFAVAEAVFALVYAHKRWASSPLPFWIWAARMTRASCAPCSFKTKRLSRFMPPRTMSIGPR